MQEEYPLYKQIKKFFLNKIKENILTPGDEIPSEKDIAKEFSVSRGTVRQAINELVQEGYLVKQRGKRTKVVQREIYQDLSGFYAFFESMERKGLTPISKLINIERVKASKEIAKNINVYSNERVYKLKRLQCVKNLELEPLIYEIAYLSCSKIPNLSKYTEEMKNNPLYDILENRYEISIDSGKEIIEIIECNKEQAKHLQISPHTPILLVTRITYSDDKAIELTYQYVNNDKMKYTVYLGKENIFNSIEK